MRKRNQWVTGILVLAVLVTALGVISCSNANAEPTSESTTASPDTTAASGTADVSGATAGPSTSVAASAATIAPSSSTTGSTTTTLAPTTTTAKLTTTTTAKATTQTTTAAPDGAKLYAKYCASCHSRPPGGSASTVKSVIVKGKGDMPAFGGKLTSAQINAIVQYVISH